jgi:hypothetical protein
MREVVLAGVVVLPARLLVPVVKEELMNGL